MSDASYSLPAAGERAIRRRGLGELPANVTRVVQHAQDLATLRNNLVENNVLLVRQRADAVAELGT